MGRMIGFHVLQKQESEVRSQNEEHLVPTLCSRLRAFRFLLTAWVLLPKQKPQSLRRTRLCSTGYRLRRSKGLLSLYSSSSTAEGLCAATILSAIGWGTIS
jgi:hypothetical protein